MKTFGNLRMALPNLGESLFMPKQSTAKVCSNTCPQRLFRQRHAAHRAQK
jgi:hypothetical protein